MITATTTTKLTTTTTTITTILPTTTTTQATKTTTILPMSPANTAPIIVPDYFSDSLNAKECINPLLVKKKEVQKPLIDIFLDPEREEERNVLVELQRNKSEQYINSANMTQLYPNLFKLLWYATLPCIDSPRLGREHMIKSCQVGGKSVECRKLFTKVPTDLGMCCALNYEKAIQDSIFADLVDEMQNSPQYTGNKNEEKMKIPASVGLKNGIRLSLDLHSNSESLGSVMKDFAAFRLFVGHPAEFPSLEESGFVLQPGHEHFLSLSSQVFSSNGIRRLHPKDRHCYFSDEGDLEFYDKYTFQNCRFECGIKLAEKEIKCTPWYLPQGKNSTICDPWQTREFLDALNAVHTNRSNCKDCLPDCEMVKTKPFLSSAKFR